MTAPDVNAHAAPPPPEEQPDDPERTGKRPPQSAQLVKLAEARYRFATSTAGEPFAVEHRGPNLARMLRGGRDSLRAELAAAYAAEHGRAPSASALADALLVLEGRAMAGHREPLGLRLARHGAGVVLDLGDPSGRAVVIEPGRWQVVDRSPVLFRRTELTGPLPAPFLSPETGTEELADLLNVAPEAWPVLAGWLVAALLPEVAHPVMLLTGEQGTGKTTAARFLAATIDPSPAQVRAAPRDPEQWAIAASGSWLVPLDNLSTVPGWLSDAICRAVTGDGLVRRRLYSDDALSVLAYRRVVMLTAIDAGSLRGDLADRLVMVDLERIPADRRRLDADLDTRFADAHPRILGALCQLTADVLAALPDVRLDVLPRMADFARVLAAVDRVAGTDSLGAYLGQRDRLAEEVVEGDEVAQALRRLATTLTVWEGTAAELLERIAPDRPPKWWPRTPRAIAGAARRAAPALRQLGVVVDFDRQAGGQRQRIIRLSAEVRAEEPSQPSHRPEQPSDQQFSGDEPGTVGGTVGTVTAQPSRQPSHPEQPSDLHKHTSRDGRDGRDGQEPLSSVENNGRPPVEVGGWCSSCGDPVWDDTCPRCEQVPA